MTWPNEIALTPASLATDGEQGEGAKAGSPSDANATGTRRGGQSAGPLAVPLARAAIVRAVARMDAYARATDDPQPGIVEVADLLDVALFALDGAT